MDKNDLTKHYTNGEITVVWKPGMCIHSKVCWQQATGLPEVFNPRVRPWIKMEAGTTEHITDQVKKCPSGALSYFANDAEPKTATPQPATTIEIMKNGPLLVQGTILIKDANGSEIIKENTTAFCRCGQSANKPYCDGSHISAGFKD